MFEPASKGYKKKEHGRSIKEGHRAWVMGQDDGGREDDEGIDIRDCCSQHDQDVHIRGVMLQSFPCCHVKVSPSNKLGNENKSWIKAVVRGFGFNPETECFYLHRGRQEKKEKVLK